MQEDIMEMNGDCLIYRDEFDIIIASDLPEMEKLAKAFGGLTGFVLETAERQVELARAMHDREEVVRQQVKMETMKHARRLFQTCHWRVTGRWAWDEQANT
jgi:hypothetical protein